MCFYHQFATYLSCQSEWKRRTKPPESSSGGVGLNFLVFLYWKAGSGFVVCWHLEYLHLMKAYSKYQYQYLKPETHGVWILMDLKVERYKKKKVKGGKSRCSWQKGKMFPSCKNKLVESRVWKFIGLILKILLYSKALVLYISKCYFNTCLTFISSLCCLLFTMIFFYSFYGFDFKGGEFYFKSSYRFFFP